MYQDHLHVYSGPYSHLEKQLFVDIPYLFLQKEQETSFRIPISVARIPKCRSYSHPPRYDNYIVI